jgi:hypothetical protein
MSAFLLYFSFKFLLACGQRAALGSENIMDALHPLGVLSPALRLSSPSETAKNRNNFLKAKGKAERAAPSLSDPVSVETRSVAAFGKRRGNRAPQLPKATEFTFRLNRQGGRHGTRDKP